MQSFQSIAVISLVLHVYLHVSSAVNIDLSTAQCDPSPTVLSGSGQLLISNSSKSCRWKFKFSPNQRLRIEGTKMCLSCSEVLKLESAAGNDVWDVATTHQRNGGQTNTKVCTLQSLYCGLAHTKEHFADTSPLILEYRRAPTTAKIDIIFKYVLYPKSMVNGGSTPHSSNPSTSTERNEATSSLILTNMLVLMASLVTIIYM